MIRVGILGCGKMGRVYTDWFSRNPDSKVCAFYNRTREKAEKLSSKHEGSVVFADWEEMIASPDVDLIGICTPSHQHKEQFIAAINSGKHVLCEKPMANDVNDCRSMLEAAEGSGSKAMVGFQMRFHPVVERVGELLKTMGSIQVIESQLSMYRPEVTWKHKLDQGGGAMKELSSHLIDMMRKWCGEVLSVSSQNIIFQEGREVEDYSLTCLSFENGAFGSINTNYLNRNKSLIKGSLICTGGQIDFQFSSYDPADSLVFIVKDEERISVPIESSGFVDSVYPGHMDSFKKEIDYFIDAIINDRDTIVSIENGVRSLEVIDASYVSSMERKEVHLPLETFDIGRLAESFTKYKNL